MNRKSRFLGKVIDKDGVLLEAVGSIDELVSFLGWVRCLIKNDGRGRNPPSRKAMARQGRIKEIQEDLMGISGELITNYPPLLKAMARQSELRITNCKTGTKTKKYKLKIKNCNRERVEKLEKEIARLKKGLPKLKGFVVPGKNEVDAVLHICRSVARRVERRVVALSRKDNVNKDILVYLNRLSSYLFMLGVSLS